MTQFSTNINKVPGLRFMADALEIQSTPGRHRLLKLKLMNSAEEIAYHLDKVQLYKALIESQGNAAYSGRNTFEELKHELFATHDISGTISTIGTQIVLDDIGLFEIKKFALNIEKIREILLLSVSAVPDIQKEVEQFSGVTGIIDLLDPERQRIPHFYIYDAYDENLVLMRRKFRAMDIDGTESKEAESLRLQCEEIEDTVRKRLTDNLSQYKKALQHNLEVVADIDVWLAKADLAIKMGLIRPEPSESTRFTGLFNPSIAQSLKLRNKSWQPIDIDVFEGPTLITGANMGGKTVLLKTVALCQFLYQFGFFVPAEHATMKTFEKIMISMGDEQSELRGLSSFASEMIKINGILLASKNKEKILALIDEPARTTNPVEGLALVKALIDHLIRYQTTSLVTTHYTVNHPGCRRLRVAGLRTEQMPLKPNIEDIQDYMDYSLTEVKDDAEVPQEAISIASILEVDKEFLDQARHYLANPRSDNNGF